MSNILGNCIACDAHMYAGRESPGDEMCCVCQTESRLTCERDEARKELSDIREALDQLDTSMGKTIAGAFYNYHTKSYPEWLALLFSWAKQDKVGQ